MATHSSVLAWRIPGTGGPGWAAVYGVAQSRTRLKRLAAAAAAMTLNLAELGTEAAELYSPDLYTQIQLN